MMPDDVTMGRLDERIDWYDRRSGSNQRSYKILKIVVIVLAALIPLLSGVPLPFLPTMGVPTWILGAMGAAIAVIEGVQALNQYYGNWISYRSTCEALKHEKYLYLGEAGPYATAVGAHALLAERVESLVSQENAKWASAQEIANRRAAQEAAVDRAKAPPGAGAGNRQGNGQPQPSRGLVGIGIKDRDRRRRLCASSGPWRSRSMV
jgi:Protein of unknown function (DUF4231)